MNPFGIITLAMILFIIAVLINELFIKRMFRVKIAILVVIAFAIQLWAEAKQGKSLDMLEYAFLLVMAIYFIFQVILFILKRKTEQPVEG